MIRLAARAAACGLAIAICAASPAVAEIYWANESGNTISRATNGGTITEPALITDAAAPRGVAIDGTYVYWAHDGAGGDAPVGNIGRALLDGTAANPIFVATAAPPQSVARDKTGLYWAQPHPTTPANPGSVGRARVADGLFPTQNFVPTGPEPCGVAANSDDVYWGNGGTPGTIGSSHGVFSVQQSFITATSDPCGVVHAVDRLYWTNLGSDSIGTAMQNGSGQNLNLVDAGAASDPCGIAVAGGHIYWTNRGTDTIGRADLDGGNPDDDFISAASVQDPCGIAVTPTAEPDPASLAFPETEAGSVSDIHAFYIANTSSAVLSFSSAALNGADAGAFEITGNGCVDQVMPPGLGCIVNARFTPPAAGDFAAELRVISAASNSPTVIPLSGHASAFSPPPEDPPAPPPAEPKRHGRTLSIAERSAALRGTLASEAPECAGGQRVALMRRRKGDDRRVGSDRTNAQGRWRVTDPGRSGRYYAVAAEGALADGAICLGATSRTIRFG